MSIYDIAFDQKTIDLLPPKKRTPVTLAYLKVFGDKLQYLHGIIFTDYADGNSLLAWNPVSAYAQGTRVYHTDNKVYEALVAIPLGPNPMPTLQPDKWVRITNDYRGVRERMHYTGQKLTLEYALNRFFRTTFRQPDDAVFPTPSDIYITELALLNSFFHTQDADQGSPVQDDNNTFVQEFIIDDNSAANAVVRIIHVPDSGASPRPGWWTAFNVDGYGDQKIRALVDVYNIAGVLYQIQTY